MTCSYRYNQRKQEKRAEQEKSNDDFNTAARHDKAYRPSLLQRVKHRIDVRIFGGEGTVRDLFR